jgi:hypothetical protein
MNASPIAAVRVAGAVTYIDLPTPPIGGICWLLREKGIFVLQRGPGVLRTIACTHAGSGALEAIDGVPDERGFFGDQDMPDPNDNIGAAMAESAAEPDSGILAANRLARSKAYAQRRGRPLYSASPVVMGSWMLDAGFLHGLTIRAAAGHDSVCAIASIVWMPVPQRVLDDIARRQKTGVGGG